MNMFSLNGEQFETEVLKPDYRSDDFPDGFGLSLENASHQPLNVAEWMARDPASIIQATRKSGALVVQNGFLEKVSGGLQVGEVPFLEDNLPWHSDGGSGCAVIALGKDRNRIEAGWKRKMPTLVAPRDGIIQAMQAQALEELRKKPNAFLRRVYENIRTTLHTRKDFEVLYRSYFSALERSEQLKMQLLEFLRKVHERARHCIVEKGWEENDNDALLLYTGADEGPAVTSRVVHARLDYDGKPVEEKVMLKRTIMTDKGFRESFAA